MGKSNEKIDNLTDFIKDMYNFFIVKDIERAEFEIKDIEELDKESKDYYKKQYKQSQQLKEKYKKLTFK